MNFLTAIRRSMTPTVSITNGVYNDTSRLFQKPVTERIRNAVIAGTLCDGRTGMIESVLNDAADSRFPLIYIRDGASDNAFVRSAMQGGWCRSLDLSGKQGALNLFRGFDAVRVKELLMDIMNEFIVVDDLMRDFCDSYLSLIFDCLRLTRRQFRLNCMGDYTPQWLEQNYQTLLSAGTANVPAVAAGRNELQTLCQMFQRQIGKFGKFAKNMAAVGLDDFLSGTVTIQDIYSSREILIVTLDSASQEKSSRIILRLLVEQLKQMESAGGGAIIVFEDCAVKACAEPFLGLLKTVHKNSAGCVYFTERSVVWWNNFAKQMNQNGRSGTYFEHPASFCNAYFVFRQNDPDERTFWAAMSGACKKWKESYHQAPMGMAYHMSPIADLFFGHIMVDAGRGYNEVDTTNVETNQLSELPYSSCMVMLETAQKIYNCRVSWC